MRLLELLPARHLDRLGTLPLRETQDLRRDTDEHFSERTRVVVLELVRGEAQAVLGRIAENVAAQRVDVSGRDRQGFLTLGPGLTLFGEQRCKAATRRLLAQVRLRVMGLARSNDALA